MHKINGIIIDFDCTAFNTVKAITRLYNEDFCYYKGFKTMDWHDVKTWTFEELTCAPEKYKDHYFNQPRFFKVLEAMPMFTAVAYMLEDKCRIDFCTMGYSPNLHLKDLYLKENYPGYGFIGVNIKEHKDKSHIDMSGKIFIDDSPVNLKTSNATVKILFGKDYDWNKDWDGIRCETWNDVFDVIEKMEEDGEIKFEG